MKYTSNDGTSAIWTYCNSTGGISPTSDTVKRLANGSWEDGPGGRPSGNNSIRENNNVLFITHGSNHSEHVWGFDDPYDVSLVDSYNRAPSTAVTKTFHKARTSYRIDIPSDVILDSGSSTIAGGYNTFNVPSEIWCPRQRTTHADMLVDVAKFNSVKLNTTRNGETYDPHFFGGAFPAVLDAAYSFVSLQAQAPFLANGEWRVNYNTYGFHIQNDSYEELITGGSHNPSHSVLIRYNITTNTWEAQNGSVSSVNYPVNSSLIAAANYTILTIICDRPNSTEQWHGFNNLSFHTTNLLKFVVEHETNISSTSTPPQSEVEVAATTSDGGGKPRRYPIVSTNLFDRQRSIFSIGNTHKDETLF
jgi:hypothetical protein